MPGITKAALSLLQFVGIDRAKLFAPLANGFVGHHDTLYDEEFFHFTKAQGESMVQPDGMTDNF